MRCGVFVAPFDELSDPRVLAGLAARAEERGWDGVFLWDHVVYRDPVRAVADPWVALAAMACATQRVRLGPLVTPPARRRPWVLARQAASLDVLSGGRLVLGLGLGGDGSGELSGFGEEEDAVRRASIMDEAIELLLACWSGEPLDHRGEHFRVRAKPFEPRPVQRPRPPLWLAARWPARRPVRRAARFDGLFPIEMPGPDALAELVAEAREHRPAGAGPFDVVVTGAPGDDPLAWSRAGATWWLTGFGLQPRLDEVRAAIDAGPPVGA